MTVCHRPESLNQLAVNFSEHITTTHASNFNFCPNCTKKFFDDIIAQVILACIQFSSSQALAHWQHCVLLWVEQQIFLFMTCLSALLVNLENKLIARCLENKPESLKNIVEYCQRRNFNRDKESLLIILNALQEEESSLNESESDEDPML